MCVNVKLRLLVIALVLVVNCCVSPVLTLHEIDKLLAEGRKVIKFSENKNIVLVLGNTGAGEKSLSKGFISRIRYILN